MLDAVAEDLSNRNPDIESLPPRERASRIVSFLRSNNYTGIAPGREYHSLEHNFLGFALKDPTYQESIMHEMESVRPARRQRQHRMFVKVNIIGEAVREKSFRNIDTIELNALRQS